MVDDISKPGSSNLASQALHRSHNLAPGFGLQPGSARQDPGGEECHPGGVANVLVTVALHQDGPVGVVGVHNYGV